MHEDARKLNETGGKLFEVLTECILKDLYGEDAVVSQPSCDTMHIKPDIVIGSPIRPSHVVLITHATAINNAGHKVDRGVEELFQIKTRFRNVPIVINLIWHSPLAWSDGYIKRMDEMFDVNWVAFRDCSSYLESLPAMIDTLKRLNAAEPREYSEIVRQSNLVTIFFDSVSECLKGARGTNARLWKLERSRNHKIIFDEVESATNTGKDLAAITALRPSLLADLLAKGRAKVDPEVAQEIRANVSRVKTLNGTYVSLEGAIVSRLGKITAFLGEKQLAEMLCEIAAKRWSNGTTVETEDVAKSRIEQVLAASTEGSLIDLIDSSWNPKTQYYTARCWPLYVAVAAIKVLIDRQFGFLNAQRRALGDTRQAFRWDLLNRYARGEKECLNRRELQKIVAVFEEEIRKLGAVSPDILLENKSYVGELEMHKVKDENPLMLFVERTLSISGIGYTGWPNTGLITQCPFAVRAGLGAASGRTAWHFQICDGRVLHVLSNYSATHKDKEYCAKARLSRYQWSRSYQASSIGEIGIILDGKWKSPETSMFSSAGVRWFPSDNPRTWINWLMGD